MVAAAIGVSAAAGLAGSAMSSSAASDAASAQADAANNASQVQLAMFNQMQGNLQPYMQLGQASQGWTVDQLSRLRNMQFNAPMDQATLAQTPGYQFALDQGIQNTNNALAAKGLNMSGAQARGLAQYTTGLASQTYQQQYNNALQQFNTNYGVQSDTYNRLAGLMSTGENAAAGVGNAGLQTGNSIANNMMQGANAQAAGMIGSANAISGGLQGLGNSALMYSMLGGGGGLYGGGAGSSPGSLWSLMNVGSNNAVL